MAASFRKMSTIKSKLCSCVSLVPKFVRTKASDSSLIGLNTFKTEVRNRRQGATSTKRAFISADLWSQQQRHNVNGARLFDRSGLSPSRRLLHTETRRIGVIEVKKTLVSLGLPCPVRAISVSSPYFFQKRTFTNDDDNRNSTPNGRRPMKLMDFQEIIWPSPLKSLRNQFFSFLIKSYFDRTFSLPGFLQGAGQAIESVSRCISEGNFEGLHGLVSHEVILKNISLTRCQQAIQEIQNNFADLNSTDKGKLSVKACDVFFKFVYEIGMIFDDDTNQRFVEITVVFQGFPGFDDISEKSGPQYYEHVMENQKDVFVCNYRFIREFTKGVDSDWTINKLNHFSPINVPVKW